MTVNRIVAIKNVISGVQLLVEWHSNLLCRAMLYLQECIQHPSKVNLICQ